MAIHYGSASIAITDDRYPDRPAIILPASASPDEVAAAAAEFLPPEPDFDAFGLWLLTTPEVQESYDLALASNAITACSLPGAVLAAAAGEIKHLRLALLLLRDQGLLANEVLVAMAQAAAAHHLPPEFLQVFEAPQ